MFYSKWRRIVTSYKIHNVTPKVGNLLNENSLVILNEGTKVKLNIKYTSLISVTTAKTGKIPSIDYKQSVSEKKK